MNFTKRSISKLKHLLHEERNLNQSVRVEMLEINLKRIMYLNLAILFLNIVVILVFLIAYTPTTMVEMKWENGIVLVHEISVIIVLLLTVAIRLNRNHDHSINGMIMIQAIFILYILAFGITVIIIDQYRAPNIIPFIMICMVWGLFILKKPGEAIIQNLIAYSLFFYAIGLFQKEPMSLITNQINGLVFAIIGICISVFIWHSERSGIIKSRKIEKQQLKLEYFAYYDDLTGLINRRKWLELLNDEIERMKVNGHHSTILLLDVDVFKKYNDEFGHPVGDRILETISALLLCELRTCDKVGRWGGEEFIILLPETSVSNGMIVAEKLRNKIEEMKLIIENQNVKVTISMGVSELTCENDFTYCYKKADRGLYLAKKNGRNRVECIR